MRPLEGSRPWTKLDSPLKHVRGQFFRELIRCPSLQEYPGALRKATVDDRLKQYDVHFVTALTETVEQPVHDLLGTIASKVVNREGDMHVMFPRAS